MIQKLRLFLDISEERRQRGSQLWQLLEPHANTIIAKFYRRVQSAAIDPVVTDAVVERLMSKQRHHWETLFTSDLDEKSGNIIRLASMKHREIDLSPLWYVAGYMLLKIEFVRVISESNLTSVEKGHLYDILDRYVAFDMGIALSSYSAIALD